MRVRLFRFGARRATAASTATISLKIRVSSLDDFEDIAFLDTLSYSFSFAAHTRGRFQPYTTFSLQGNALPMV